MATPEKGGLELVRAEIGEQPTHEAAVIGFADDIVVFGRFLRSFLFFVRCFCVFWHALCPF